jgi:hypothetical protein
MTSLLTSKLFMEVGVLLVFIGVMIALALAFKGILSLAKLCLLLSCAVVLSTIFSIGLMNWHGEQIEYDVNYSPACEANAGPENQVTEYSDLSPETQDVFRSALQATQADEVYTTSRLPRELTPERPLDDSEIYIQYESKCYNLVAMPRYGEPGFTRMAGVTVGGGILAGGFVIYAGIVGHNKRRQ